MKDFMKVLYAILFTTFIPARLVPSIGTALKEKFERGEKFE